MAEVGTVFEQPRQVNSFFFRQWQWVTTATRHLRPAAFARKQEQEQEKHKQASQRRAASLSQTANKQTPNDERTA
eukprot:scaffold27520_cov84-Isochrysis_galbana.AAC.1